MGAPKKPHRHRRKFFEQDQKKEDISINSLIFYNLLFFIPIVIALVISWYLADLFSETLETSKAITVQLIMLAFTLFIFMFIIPYIRKRENIRGIRYALIGFLIVAVGISVPAMLQGDFSLLLIQVPHIASYILLTFVYCPEVLGMDTDLSLWFAKSKQLLIVLVYASIVLFYITGFAYLFYKMYQYDNLAFSFGFDDPPTFGTFWYYSVVTFTTMGYGEIVPLGTSARMLASIEAVVAMIINVVFIAILFVFISNFQVFIHKEEEQEMKKEEKMIEKLEEQEKEELARIKKEEEEIQKIKEEEQAYHKRDRKRQKTSE